MIIAAFILNLLNMPINSNCDKIDEFIMQEINKSDQFIGNDFDCDQIIYDACEIYYLKDRGYNDLAFMKIENFYINHSQVNTYYEFVSGLKEGLIGNEKMAITHYERSIELDNNEQQNYWARLALAELLWYDDSIMSKKLLDESIKINSNFWLAIQLRGLLLYNIDNDFVYSEYMAIPTKYRTSETFRILGDLTFNKMEIEESERLYMQALHLDDSNSYALYGLGAINLYYKKLPEKAALYYATSIELKGDNVFSDQYVGLGWAYYDLGFYFEARECFEKSLEVESNLSNYTEFAQFYIFTEQFELAQDLINEMGYLYPNTINLEVLIFLYKQLSINETINQNDFMIFSNYINEKFSKDEVSWCLDFVSKFE